MSEAAIKNSTTITFSQGGINPDLELAFVVNAGGRRVAMHDAHWQALSSFATAHVVGEFAALIGLAL
jgi:hypothetical protein